MSSFCKCKSYSHFFSKNITIYAIFNDQSFNDTLTNDIVSFEQLGPDKYNDCMVSIPTAKESGIPCLLCFHSDPSPIIPYLIREQNSKFTLFPLKSIPNQSLPYQRVEFQVYSVFTKIHPQPYLIREQNSVSHSDPSPIIPYLIRQQNSKFIYIYPQPFLTLSESRIPFPLRSIPNHSLPHQTAEFQVYSISTQIHPQLSLTLSENRIPNLLCFHQNPSQPFLT